MHVRYSPLGDQFADCEEIWTDLRALVRSGDFTLGKVVAEFEAEFADILGARYAVGVGSGTDALKLPLRALDLPHGSEVITSANTFWATVGAIHEVGCRAAFVDCDERFCTDAERIEAAITPRTRAIMPVHLTGDVADMPRIMQIAERHGLAVIEDGCQSLCATIDGVGVGHFGIATGFSLHPLKILNVWGDAGVVTTNDDAMAQKLRLLRNHGLANRDEMVMLGYNTRLDSAQAVVGRWILRQARDIVAKRRGNAAYYDAAFLDVDGIRIPPRSARTEHVYLLYVLFCDRRDDVLRHCLERGVEAKVHYPIPIYRQRAVEHLGYKPGDFPVTDRHTREVLTLPVDQHMTRAQQDHVIDTIRSFYRGSAR